MWAQARGSSSLPFGTISFTPRSGDPPPQRRCECHRRIMGKQRNTRKRHRDAIHRRKKALVARYKGVEAGRIEVDDKKKALQLIAEQLERRGWDIEAILAAETSRS